MCIPKKQTQEDTELKPLYQQDGTLNVDNTGPIIPEGVLEHVDSISENFNVEDGILGFMYESGNEILIVYSSLEAEEYCEQEDEDNPFVSDSEEEENLFSGNLDHDDVLNSGFGHVTDPEYEVADINQVTHFEDHFEEETLPYIEYDESSDSEHEEVAMIKIDEKVNEENSLKQQHSVVCWPYNFDINVIAYIFMLHFSLHKFLTDLLQMLL